jgi:hypothetical protein
MFKFAGNPEVPISYWLANSTVSFFLTPLISMTRVGSKVRINAAPRLRPKMIAVASGR